MNVKQRLKSFIESQDISINQFEKLCGLSSGYVGNIRVSIQPGKLSNISHRFPDLNTGWLLTGEGEMLKKTGANQSSESKNIPNEFIQQLFDERKRHDEIVLSQQKTIELLVSKIGSDNINQ